MKESFALVISLKNPRLTKLIDYKKLILSSLFEEALTYALEHCLKHRDTTLIERLVNAIEPRDYKIFLSDWFSKRIGLKAKNIGGLIKLSYSGDSTDEKISFKVSLKEYMKHGISFQKIQRELIYLKDTEKEKEKKQEKQKKDPPKKIDMLDSWARLPGSYGAGKRI